MALVEDRLEALIKRTVAKIWHDGEVQCPGLTVAYYAGKAKPWVVGLAVVAPYHTHGNRKWVRVQATTLEEAIDAAEKALAEAGR